MASNFGELKTEIADTLNRTDLTSVLPTFIKSGHAKVNRELRTRQMIQRATASIDSEYTQLPSDFLQVRDIRLNTDPIKNLELITAEQQNQERQRFGYTSGEPKYFTIVGETFQVFPTPDTTYTCELAYYQKIPDFFSSDADTNWLLTKASDIYLYGSLVYIAPYLKDDERTVVFQTLYRDVLQSLNTEEEKSRYSGTTPRMRHRSFG